GDPRPPRHDARGGARDAVDDPRPDPRDRWRDRLDRAGQGREPADPDRRPAAGDDLGREGAARRRGRLRARAGSAPDAALRRGRGRRQRGRQVMKTLRESAVGLLLLGTAVLPSAAAQAPADQDRDFAVRCGTLHVGDGRVLNDVWLIVQDGDVARIVEGDAAPAGMRVVDASDKIVMPGIVAADSDLSGHPDAEYNVTPDCVALDGFDLFREHRVPLSGGVTTVYLSPGRNRLVPGQGSVVKLAGLDVVERVLAETACLRITLGAAASQAPAVFEPTVYPTSDDPLLPARRQYPSSRLSQLATLRALFQEAAATPENGLEGPG